MEATARFVVVKEPDVAFCRLRRGDSLDIKGLAPLWEGASLRAGYDAMIRLNRDMSFRSWRVVERNGRYRAAKEAATGPEWRTVEVCTDRDTARVRATHFNRRREEILTAMIGEGRRRLTQKDRQYMAWRMRREEGSS